MKLVYGITVILSEVFTRISERFFSCKRLFSLSKTNYPDRIGNFADRV
jgi:Gpi18-like mannosyltransferase